MADEVAVSAVFDAAVETFGVVDVVVHARYCAPTAASSNPSSRTPPLPSDRRRGVKMGKGMMVASQPTGSPRNLGILMRSRIAALRRRFVSDSYGCLRGRPWQMKLGGRPAVDVGVRGHLVGRAVERSIRWMVKCLRSGPPAKVALD